MPTFRVNKLNTKTRDWSGASSIMAESFAAAVKALIAGFTGMHTRRTKDGFTVKEANLKVVVTEDRSSLP